MSLKIKTSSKVSKKKTIARTVCQRSSSVTKRVCNQKARLCYETSTSKRNIICERPFELEDVGEDFTNIINKRQWNSLIDYNDPPNATLVKEFYARLAEDTGTDQDKVYVRNKLVPFNPEVIRCTLKLPPCSLPDSYATFKKMIDRKKQHLPSDLRDSGTGHGEMPSSNYGCLTDLHRTLAQLIRSSIWPSSQVSWLSNRLTCLIWLITQDAVEIPLHEIIYDWICKAAKSKKSCLGFPCLITKIAYDAGVAFHVHDKYMKLPEPVDSVNKVKSDAHIKFSNSNRSSSSAPVASSGLHDDASLTSNPMLCDLQSSIIAVEKGVACLKNAVSHVTQDTIGDNITGLTTRMSALKAELISITNAVAHGS
ncbi:hypothetical protein ABKV19_004877 [Rosa sericea]